MTKERLAIILVVCGCIMITVFAMFSGTPVSKYVPKNAIETDIKSLLLRYQTAKNDHDLDNLMQCLTDEGQFMYSGHLMVSKSKLRELLPKYWADIQSGDLIARPICRENLNGNLFQGWLYDPIIQVENDSAKVFVTFVSSVRWRTMLFLYLHKIENRWYIDRLKWDMG